DAVSPRTARPRCDRCRRPLSHCLCAHIPSLPNRTRVLVLQHPDEVKHPLSTAGLAVLGLQNAELWVGEHFPELERELSERGPAVLLFPAKEGREGRDEGCDRTSIRKQDGDEGRDPERVQDEDRCQNQSANQDRDNDSAPAPAVRAEDAYDLLIVPDGTWRKARRIVRANPILQVLP